MTVAHDSLATAIRLHAPQGLTRPGNEICHRWGVSLRLQRRALELARRTDPRDEAFDPHPGSAILIAA